MSKMTILQQMIIRVCNFVCKMNRSNRLKAIQAFYIEIIAHEQRSLYLYWRCIPPFLSISSFALIIRYIPCLVCNCVCLIYTTYQRWICLYVAIPFFFIRISRIYPRHTDTEPVVRLYSQPRYFIYVDSVPFPTTDQIIGLH